MSLRLLFFVSPVMRLSLLATLPLLLLSTPAFTQKPLPVEGTVPRYDLQTEAKTKGIVEETKLFTWGSRKDFVELILKSGDDTVSVYLCPKSFEDEIGVTFSKGDEVAVTGSKVKQDAADVILAREVVRGTDTLMFRDNKGKPVWDWRTGK